MVFRTIQYKTFTGIIIAIGIAISGVYLSEWIGKDLLGFSKSPVSSIMTAIILGLILGNSIKQLTFFHNGFQFCIKYVLRFGIILLGIRLSLGDMISHGMKSIIVIIPCIVFTLFLVDKLKGKFQLSEKLATLIAVGTSICGATAIVALSPSIKAEKEETTYAIANITLFGLLAMFFYPIGAHFLFGSHSLAAGLFLGSSIHETAQVTGAGMIYAEHYLQPQVLEIATVTKLVRNTTMVLVIPFLAYRFHSGHSDINTKSVKLSSIFPFFILGFIGFGLIRTIGDMTVSSSEFAFGIITESSWREGIVVIKRSAEFCLAVAMSAVGLNTNFRSFKSLGLKPFYFGFLVACFVGIMSLLIIQLVII